MPRTEIRENYDLYKRIVYFQKTTTISPIMFNSDKPSRNDYLYHKSPVIQQNAQHAIDFIAEQKKFNDASYKFQIICSKFCEVPLFRFDSDGAVHRNRDSPLKDQQVPTPHFNYFNKEGLLLAYNDGLEGVKFEDLKDLNKFFSLFCKECSLSLDSGEIPIIVSGDARVLGLDITSFDILNDVNFEL